MSKFTRVLFTIVQCTWGIGATVIGLFFFIKNIKRPHGIYRGTIETKWDNPWGGLSMGLFIFTPNAEEDYFKKVRVHEYGHCIQSLVLGPVMLILGIISVIWGSHPYFINMRKEKGIPYTACFVESWASKWGEMVTGEEAIWN